MKHRDIALSAAALVVPAAAMVGAALALLKPVPLPAARLPAKVFTERFAAFAELPPSQAEPEEPPPQEPLPPVPLPPVRPPPEPAPESPPPSWTPSGAVARSSGLRAVAADICVRYGGRRVETARSWHCAFRHR
jgi:hypothetical protein